MSDDLAALQRKLAARKDVPGFAENAREIEARIAAIIDVTSRPKLGVAYKAAPDA